MNRLNWAILLLSLHLPLSAQQSSKAIGTKEPPTARSGSSASIDKISPTPSRFAQVPFDSDAEKLAVGYRGHSCAAVARRFKAFKPVKDEFETSAAYADRVEKLRSTFLYGTVTAASPLAFSTEVPAARVTYDADSEKMNVRIFAGKGTLIDGKFFESNVVDRQVESRSEYVGANAYGRKVNVTRTRYLVCALAFNNIDTITRKVRSPSNFSFNITPAEAKLSKEHLALLYILAAAPPFIVEYSDYAGATIDSPSELSFGGDVLVGTLKQVWLYNVETGQILAREALPEN